MLGPVPQLTQILVVQCIEGIDAEKRWRDAFVKTLREREGGKRGRRLTLPQDAPP